MKNFNKEKAIIANGAATSAAGTDDDIGGKAAF